MSNSLEDSEFSSSSLQSADQLPAINYAYFYRDLYITQPFVGLFSNCETNTFKLKQKFHDNFPEEPKRKCRWSSFGRKNCMIRINRFVFFVIFLFLMSFTRIDAVVDEITNCVLQHKFDDPRQFKACDGCPWDYAYHLNTDTQRTRQGCLLETCTKQTPNDGLKSCATCVCKLLAFVQTNPLEVGTPEQMIDILTEAQTRDPALANKCRPWKCVDGGYKACGNCSCHEQIPQRHWNKVPTSCLLTACKPMGTVEFTGYLLCKPGSSCTCMSKTRIPIYLPIENSGVARTLKKEGEEDEDEPPDPSKSKAQWFFVIGLLLFLIVLTRNDRFNEVKYY